MILDIRGTNGAGKSFIVHFLLNRFPNCSITADDGKAVTGYWCANLSTAVVGRYSTQCGGCDTIKTAQGIEDRIRCFAGKHPNVLLEGLMVSHTYSRYNDLAKELGDYKFLFLTTPLEVCIERIRTRRLQKGVQKPYDPYRKHAVVDDFAKVLSAKRKLIDAGREVADLDWEGPIPTVLTELGYAVD